MNAHFMRHKSRLTRFVHRHFYPVGSTMVTFPLFLFWRRQKAAVDNRPKLATLLRQVRADPAQYAEFKGLACF